LFKKVSRYVGVYLRRHQSINALYWFLEGGRLRKLIDDTPSVFC